MDRTSDSRVTPIRNEDLFERASSQSDSTGPDQKILVVPLIPSTVASDANVYLKVTWDSTSDLENPKNWTLTRKWLVRESVTSVKCSELKYRRLR